MRRDYLIFGSWRHQFANHQDCLNCARLVYSKDSAGDWLRACRVDGARVFLFSRACMAWRGVC